jgi:peptide subunit release factor 1 (eRF1)
MNHYDLNPVNRAETSIASRMGNLAGEFFNRVDKQLNEIYKKNPLPVIICTDGSNYPDYLKVADNKAIIEGKVDGNRMLEKPHQVIEAAWPVMKEVQATKNAERLSELKAAVNNNKFLTDYNEIWEAVNNGRGKTLFVKQGFFQPALLDNNKIKLVSTSDIGKANVDDIIDEMIEKILQSNGDAVFINGDGLDKFQGLALTTRY